MFVYIDVVVGCNFEFFLLDLMLLNFIKIGNLEIIFFIFYSFVEIIKVLNEFIFKCDREEVIFI